MLQMLWNWLFEFANTKNHLEKPHGDALYQVLFKGQRLFSIFSEEVSLWVFRNLLNWLKKNFSLGYAYRCLR